MVCLQGAHHRCGDETYCIRCHRCDYYVVEIIYECDFQSRLHLNTPANAVSQPEWTTNGFFGVVNEMRQKFYVNGNSCV